MSKRIIAREKNGKEWWVITPNIGVYTFATNPKAVTFLEIFYFFAQALVRPGKKKLTKVEEEKIMATRKRALVELDNKVTAIKFLASECRKHAKALIGRPKHKKRIYDCKPYQVVLSLVECYLDTLHSIYDCITTLDRDLGYTFAESIHKESWFQIDIDLRNVFHHNQSPLLSIESGKLLFMFERLPKAPKYLKPSMRNPFGRYEFILDPADLDGDILDFLNKWAKKYIDLIDENENIGAVTGHHKDGRIKRKKVTLKELKKIARFT